MTVTSDLTASERFAALAMPPAAGAAFDPWRTWRDFTGGEALVASAILAASPRNVQPWQFTIAPDRIGVYAEFPRSSGPLDPFSRELYEALGCAIENIAVAAREQGRVATVVLADDADRTHVADVLLTPGPAEETDLYHALPHRRTNRAPFADRPVDEVTLDEISLRCLGIGQARLVWFTDPAERERLGGLLVAATEAIVADPDQAEDLIGWFRRNAASVQEHRDGMTTAAMSASASATATVGAMADDEAFRAAGQFWIDISRIHVQTAAGFGVVIVPDATEIRHRIDGGRLLQRAHLAATAHGLAVGHLNMMTVRADRERHDQQPPRFTGTLAELARGLGEVMAVFRIGHPAHPAPASPRRGVAEVLRVS